MATINDMPRMADISVDNALTYCAIGAYSKGHTLDYEIIRNDRDDSAVVGTCPHCGLRVSVSTLVGNADRGDFPDYKITWSTCAEYNGHKYVPRDS